MKGLPFKWREMAQIDEIYENRQKRQKVWFSLKMGFFNSKIAFYFRSKPYTHDFVEMCEISGLALNDGKWWKSWISCKIAKMTPNHENRGYV